MKGFRLLGYRDSLDGILRPIWPAVQQLCWALEDAFFSGIPDETLRGAFELRPGVPVVSDDGDPAWDSGPSICEVAWCKPGHLINLAPFLYGDWDSLLALPYPPPCEREDIDTSREWIANNALIYLACIDGAFWEFYSSEASLLEILRIALPTRTEHCNLADKLY